MTTTVANAIHQPSNFVPADYEYIDSFDSQPEPGTPGDMVWDEQLQRLVSLSGMYLRMLDRSKTSRFYERGQCDHCGARIRYVAVLVHTPSGDHVAFGHDCLSNRVGNYSHAQFRMDFIRTAAQNTRAMNERLAKQAAFIEANPACAMLVDYSGTNDFFQSLADQLRRKGELSERQAAAVVRAVERDAQRAAQRAADEAAHPAAPAPSGKVTVTGEVLSTKEVENAYGVTTKMLVRDDRGFKVWVTRPAALDGSWNADGTWNEPVDRGARITFSATLEVSDRDECFAFGKRPTKAQVLS